MNNTVKGLFIFTFGAALGSFVTWRLIKCKYEKIAQEEIDSVKETFSKRAKSDDISDEEVKKEKPEPFYTSKMADKPDINEYAKKLRDEGYTNYSNVSSETEPETADGEPYVISPEEFGEEHDYTVISLTYFADGVLADDQEEAVDDVERLVGPNALNSFGEYEDDAVYVRNDRLKCDYEILLDKRTYEELVAEKPYLIN